MILVSGTHETANGQALAKWLGDKTGAERQAPYSILGWVTPEGEIQTAALFNDYRPGGNIELHFFGWVTRQGLRDTFHYAFVHAGACRVTAKPYRSNRPLRSFIERLGFVQEGVMKRYYGPRRSQDAVIYRLDRHVAQKWMD